MSNPWLRALATTSFLMTLVGERPLEGIRTGPTARQTSTASRAVVLPLETPRGALIAVRGAIGKLERLRLLLDTGAYRSVLDDRIALELKLRGTADKMFVFGQALPAERIALPDLRLGPILKTDLPVLAADLSGLARRLGWQPDAIVGLDVLRGHCLIVDHRARQLIFECTSGWATNVACDPHSPYLVVSASIDDVDHRLQLDTGSDAIALHGRAAAKHADAEEQNEVTAETLAGTVRLRRFTARRLRIGSTLLQKHPVVVIPSGEQDLGIDGILGIGSVASRFQLDLKRMVISW